MFFQETINWTVWTRQKSATTPNCPKMNIAPFSNIQIIGKFEYKEIGIQL